MKNSCKALLLSVGVLSFLTLPVRGADMGAPGGAAPGAPAAKMPTGELEATAVTTTFTVQNVDPATRMVTLQDPGGAITKFKAGPEVRNFDQIKKGDLVKATVLDELAVAIRPGGGAPMASEKQMIAVAPKGAKPGVVMVQTDQMTAKIMAIDTDKRLVSLEGPTGMTRTIKAAPKVDLSQLKKGDDVTVQVAQGMAIMVESPQASDQP